MTDFNQQNTEQTASVTDVLAAKMLDADIPGMEVEFTPEEADLLGAFPEDALSEADALASSVDME